jgi:hypothetical protein
MVASLSRVVVACLLFLSLGGCANYIFRSFDIDSGESLSLDAKQRLVLATYKGGKSGNRKIVCAEPSPDAFSASSASAAASAAFTFPTLLPGGQTGTDGGQPKTTSGSGGIAAARGESAASIGMRTQTIQLLRDGLYRACEAYMNGAIDQHQYNIILLNIDKLMVTLLGIDAIGGTPKAPAVSIVAAAPQVNTSSNKDGATAGAGSAENNNDADKGNGDSGKKNNTDKPPKTAQPLQSESVDPSGVQAEAIANIVLAANSHSSTPALCISLLASGELRPNNPGQASVLKSCDYLLHGSIRKALFTPEIPPPTRYKMSPLTK